jgi:hypothetical protein
MGLDSVAQRAFTNKTLQDSTAAVRDHNHTLDSLSNVLTTGKAAGNVLKWNGTNWVDSTDNSAAGGSGSGTLDSVRAYPGVAVTVINDSVVAVAADTTVGFWFTQAEGNAKQAAGTYLIPTDSTNFRGFTNKTLQDSTSALRTDLYRKSSMGTDSTNIRAFTNKTLQDSTSALRTDLYRKSSMGTDSIAIRNYTNKTLQDSASALRTDLYRKSSMGTDSTSIRNFTNKTLQDSLSAHRTDLARKDALDDSINAYKTKIEVTGAEYAPYVNTTGDSILASLISRAELNFLDGASSAIQTQLDGKLDNADSTTLKNSVLSQVLKNADSTTLKNSVLSQVLKNADSTTIKNGITAAYEAKATIRLAFRSGVMDSLAISDTVSLGRIYPGATADTVIYDMSRGSGVTVKLEMVDSLFQTVAGTKIDSSQCTVQVRKVVNTTALTAGKLIRMVVTVVATEPKYFEATILAHH